MLNVIFWTFVLIGVVVLVGKKFNFNLAGIKMPNINFGINGQKILYVVVGLGATWLLWDFFELTKDDIRKDPIAILLGAAMLYGWSLDTKGAKTWGTVAFVGLVAIWLWDTLPEWYGREKYGNDYEAVAEVNRQAAVAKAKAAATKALETATQGGDRVGRVVSEYVTIPAKGTVTIPLLKRCYTDSFTDEAGKKVSRKEASVGLVYNSSNDTEITRKVWFFDEGGNCEEDFAKLLPTQIFR